MISNKWLTLYHYLCRQVTTFPTPQESETALNDKLMFLRAQFLKGTQEPDPQQVDWLEHEAFTLVVSDAIQNLSLTESDLAFLFDTLMAAQLCQLAMVMLNAHKDVMPAPTFHLRCGLVSQKLGDYELATTSFEQALENTPNDASTLCHLGFNALYQDQTEQATLYFEQSIAADPGFAGGYQNLAGLHYQQGDFSQAADFAEKAQQRAPTLAAAYITAISSLLALGKTLEADNWVTRAIENQVSSPELVRLAGICAHKNGRPQEALEALSHYLAHHPDSVDVLNIRAHVYAELKMYPQLEADIHQLRGFEPHDPWSLEQLFLCHFHAGKWADAQAVMVQLNRLAARYKITYREQLNTIYRKLSLNVVELS